MFDIENELKKRNLDTDTYERILKDCSDKVHKISEMDWSDIIDKYALDIHYDSLRKASQTIFGSVFVSEYYKWKESQREADNKEDAKSSSSYLKELEEKKRGFERAKIQYRDERAAWQKQNFIAARLEQKLDYLEEQLIRQGRINFKVHDTPIINGTNNLIVCLSDLHIGQTFKSTFGEFNSKIAKIRLEQYLNEILEIRKIHNAKNVYIASLGDQLSGSIHKSIAITNREDIIEQLKMTIEYITSFCYELTNHFENVYFYNVSGNHSRIDKKEESLHSERLDDLIGWDVCRSLDHISNFHPMLDKNLDVGIAKMDIDSKSYILCHGDYDNLTKQGAANLSMMIGFLPYAIIMGHKHHPAITEVNGIKMIQTGSLAGSGDSYTIENRLSGKPNQTVMICDDNGIKSYYTINLD
ncbi:hypothetical protein [Clostridium sp.]|uniref:hypothetical protein n=1 Tax=Clostridium sp. TaxID=1506 RepID=UPI0032169731